MEQKIKFDHSQEQMCDVLGIDISRLADIYESALEHFPGEQPLVKDSKFLDVCLRLCKNLQEGIAMTYYVAVKQHEMKTEFDTENNN